jgi:hypothetical protein
MRRALTCTLRAEASSGSLAIVGTKNVRLSLLASGIYRHGKVYCSVVGAGAFLSLRANWKACFESSPSSRRLCSPRLSCNWSRSLRFNRHHALADESASGGCCDWMHLPEHAGAEPSATGSRRRLRHGFDCAIFGSLEHMHWSDAGDWCRRDRGRVRPKGDCVRSREAAVANLGRERVRQQRYCHRRSPRSSGQSQISRWRLQRDLDHYRRGSQRTYFLR